MGDKACPVCGAARDEVLMPPQGWFTHKCENCGDGPFIETTRGEIIRSTDPSIEQGETSERHSAGAQEAGVGPLD